MILSLFSMAYMHEESHRVIYGYYGIESHIEMFSNFPDGVTIGEDICEGDCLLAQSIADGFFYPLIIFALLIAISFMYLIGIKCLEIDS